MYVHLVIAEPQRGEDERMKRRRKCYLVFFGSPLDLLHLIRCPISNPSLEWLCRVRNWDLKERSPTCYPLTNSIDVVMDFTS